MGAPIVTISITESYDCLKKIGKELVDRVFQSAQNFFVKARKSFYNKKVLEERRQQIRQRVIQS